MLMMMMMLMLSVCTELVVNTLQVTACLALV